MNFSPTVPEPIPELIPTLVPRQVPEWHRPAPPSSFLSLA